jgi:hypothetical protein
LARLTAFGPLAAARILPLAGSVRRAITREFARLAAGELPAASDYPTLHPYAGTAWARHIPAIALWLLYTFDNDRATLEDVRAVEPMRLEE